MPGTPGPATAESRPVTSLSPGVNRVQVGSAAQSRPWSSSYPRADMERSAYKRLPASTVDAWNTPTFTLQADPSTRMFPWERGITDRRPLCRAALGLRERQATRYRPQLPIYRSCLAPYGCPVDGTPGFPAPVYYITGGNAPTKPAHPNHDRPDGAISRTSGRSTEISLIHQTRRASVKFSAGQIIRRWLLWTGPTCSGTRPTLAFALSWRSLKLGGVRMSEWT
jgi:hypothetical protein